MTEVHRDPGQASSGYFDTRMIVTIEQFIDRHDAHANVDDVL